MSIWRNYDLENRVRTILASVPFSRLHSDRPFLSGYQIAIAFMQRFPEDADGIAKSVGGVGTGRHDSLAQYFANQLSRRISDCSLIGIERRFLSGRFLSSLEYGNDHETVVSSLGSKNMAVFRLAERPPNQ